MTSSPLKKLVVTPLVISAAAFSVLTLPLPILGSKPVTVQLQGEPVFYGKLRDIATPYLGLASAISLGLGIASVAVSGWRSSAHQSSQAQAELSDLAQHLKEKEAQLEALKLSAQRLEASGLSPFLDESATTEPTTDTVTAYLNTVPKLVEPLVITTHPYEAQPAPSPQINAQAAAAKFSAAQSFLGYTQAKASRKPSIQENSPAPEDVEQLHTQLQQIMTQIASLQKTLSDQPQDVKSQEAASSPTQVVTPASSRRLQVVKSWSVL